MIKTWGMAMAGALLLSGCVQLKPNEATESLVLPIPQAVDPSTQANFIRLSQLIQSGKYQDNKLSQLFFQRGIVLGKMGLAAMARLDLSRAIRVAPDYAPPYNLLGLYYLEQKDFPNAYEAFDSSIELDPHYDYAYFSRALALYYGHKYRLASRDITRYQAPKLEVPYRAIWKYLIARHQSVKEAKSQLMSALQKSPDTSDWGWQLVGLFTGNVSAEQLLAAATEPNDEQVKAQRLCEAYFYLGKYEQLQGHHKAANNDFKLALAGNVYQYVEYTLARLELNLQNSVPDEPDAT